MGHDAIELSDPEDLLPAETRCAQQLLNVGFAVEVNVTALTSKSYFSDWSPPGPESGKSQNRFVSADFSHPFQHRKRIANVVEQSDAKANVKRRIRFVVEEISLNERTSVRKVFLLGRLATQIDHYFGNVQADDLCCAFARELLRIHTVTATYIQECSILNRLEMLDRKGITLIHVLPEDLVQRNRKSRFAMGVNLLEGVGFAVPKRSLGLNLVIQI